jgi:uncharacterized protein YjiS (DUF1127 family)
METVMGTISSAPNAAQGMFAPSALGGWLATLTHWWAAYIAWRIEQAAIAQLGLLGDRELKDIGLTRSIITRAVRVEAARDCAFSRYYTEP